MHCPTCSSGVVVAFPTTTTASGCQLECADEMHPWVNFSGPSTADVPQPPSHQGSALIERIVDHEVNVLHVLGFLASGDGGVKVGRLLGLSGLKNATTMGPRSFGIAEECIGPVMQQHAEGVMQNHLVEEVHLSHGNRTDDDGTLLFDLWKDGELDKDNHALWPHLTGTCDMGWQGHASGKKCNSLTPTFNVPIKFYETLEQAFFVGIDKTPKNLFVKPFPELQCDHVFLGQCHWVNQDRIGGRRLNILRLCFLGCKKLCCLQAP